MQHEKKSTVNLYKIQSNNFFKQITKTQWLFLIILAIGIFARTWNFRNTPPGLNPDEASIGIEAYDLYNFGVDRNGISYPIHLISWGSGQNALYAYMLIPLIAIKGTITPLVIRLPMILSGILSLPLMYYVGKKMFGIKYALIAMFFMAISPYHIVNTRWAVESNILPFIFLAGFACFLASKDNGLWFIPACVCFALCLYAYGTAYIAIPVFMALCIPAAIYLKKLEIKHIVPGLVLFFLFSLPIFLFILINTFKLDAIHIGSITIPRLPTEARYESLAAISEKTPLNTISDNLVIMFNLLWKQEDDFSWNFVEPFGYFYKFTFPLVVIGFLLLLMSFKGNTENRFERWLLFSWVAASISIGVMLPSNLTRINLIFTPILFCIVICLVELDKRIKFTLPVVLIILSAAFTFFTFAYHGRDYQRQAEWVFNAGIIPAVEYANENNSPLTCITEQTAFSYIYVLYVKKLVPTEYVDQIEWVLPLNYPLNPARAPKDLAGFRFKVSDCKEDPNAAYILTLRETPPTLGIDYKSQRFGKYQIYLPKTILKIEK